MKTRLAARPRLSFCSPPWPSSGKLALPGYRYQFPRDHFSHPDYQTEWWYYTGNLRAADGHRFGFELTFFRQALHLPERIAASRRHDMAARSNLPRAFSVERY